MKLQVAGRLSGTEEYYFSRKLREIEQMNQSGERVINLGIGSPDLPPAKVVTDTLSEEAAKADTHGYQSYKGIPALREAMAAWYGRYYGVSLDPNKEVLPLMGSKEGIVHVCMTYLEEGDEALIPNPGYPTYASAVRLSGATAVPYRMDEAGDWLPDLEVLAGLVTERTKLMWLNYPHMPTGTRAPESFFEELVAFARERGILLCHDNPYSFILNDQPRSLLSVPGALDVAIELNSLSKSANMAGWRIGMLMGHADRISEILRFKSNMDSGMFLPAQKAAVRALELGPEWYAEMNREYQERKKLATALLDLLGCQYRADQSGLFVWARIPADRHSGYELIDEVLNEARVFLAPGGIFGDAGNAYVRISLCANQDTFGEALERVRAMKS
ncbi:MAG TPA: aminotransferase class I/II-fold pyridoxal phosphate-dependent enzyme [Sphingobacteriaceae bacterium]|nr:aminotransferase class I/II-fold pyridoxal phosphate-dependent enzyme [Sphingobacteriaceae bacterium]